TGEETAGHAGEAAAPGAEPHPDPAPHTEPQLEAASAAPEAERPRPVSPWVVAPVSGAVAAALVIGVGWLLGWPSVPRRRPRVAALCEAQDRDEAPPRAQPPRRHGQRFPRQ
ncbi:MAG: hypothetical protein ACK463_21490, partial [Bradyrhizobium sp.]